MHRLALEHDEAHAASGARLVVGDEVVGAKAVAMAKRGEMRLEDDAVPQSHGANAKGAEQPGEGGIRLRLDRAREAHRAATSTRLPERAAAAIASRARMLATASSADTGGGLPESTASANASAISR